MLWTGLIRLLGHELIVGTMRRPGASTEYVLSKCS